MTTPDSGATRPGRIAGVALLGLAAVALILGLVTAVGGADSESAERPPDPPATTTSSSTSEKPPPKTTTSTKPPATTTSSRPPATSEKPSQTPPPDGNGEPSKAVPVRVLNNSKIKGLAATAAEDFKADGWQVVEIGNYPDTNVPTTTVYFRPGTEEEAAANAIAKSFGLEVAPRIESLRGHPAGVIIIVTSDYANDGKDEN